MGFLALIILGIIIHAVYKSVKKESTPINNDIPITFNIRTSFGDEDEIDVSISSDDVWVPKKKSVSIKNIQISSGLFYMGSGLGSVDYEFSIEPSLIDPKLPVTQTNKNPSSFDLGYWPSYRKLSSEARYVFLKWLANGRNHPNIDIGFVFIYFYGLERRVLTDMQTSINARSEIYDIISEVERLLSIYNSNDSLQGYASRFLEFIKIKYQKNKIKVGLPSDQSYHDIPLSFKLGLSYYSKMGKPIPPSWAFYWFQNYPYYRPLRTAAERCQREFVELFKVKYYEKFNDGLIISEPKRRLKIYYKPASRSFSGVQKEIVTSLPDVISLDKPLKQIEVIVDSSIEDLDAYSRYLGRKPDEKNSLTVLSLLPQEINISRYNNKIIELDDSIRNRMKDNSGIIIPAKEIIKYWSLKSNNSLTNSENISVVNVLDRLGYSVEPDIRFTNIKIKPSGKIVIFLKPEESPNSPTEEYKAAQLILTLSISVCSADGEVSDKEKKHLIKHIQSILKLTKSERIRLSALFAYLIVEPPKLSTLRKRIEAFSETQRKAVLQFLISIANADSNIDPEEIKILKKIYKFLDFEPESVYSDIHKNQTTSVEEPVVVKYSKHETDYGYKIPDHVHYKGEAFDLNKKLIDKRTEDTKKVFDMLKDLFEEKEEEFQISPIKKDHQEPQTIANLDGEHTMIVKKLIEKDVLPRSEFEDICSKYGLLPDGVIEIINDNFFNCFNENLIEDEDDLKINQDIVKEIHDV